MPTDKKINELVFNQLTKEQYDTAKEAGELSNDEFYMIIDDDYKNAILLDGQTLKDVSGEDITEDIKAVVAPTITGNVGDFVVIGEDGKLTAKTIVAAEGVSF